MSILYYFSLILALVCGIYRYSVLDSASRIIVLYVGLSVLSEGIGYYASVKYRNNAVIYAVDSLIEFGLISLYFNSIIDVFRKRNIGYYIGAAGIILGILNLIYVQGLSTVNSYFLVFEGIFIIGMSLFSFFQLLLKADNLHLTKYPHFWFATILIFIWSATIIIWSLYDYILAKFVSRNALVADALNIVGIITFTGISCVYIFYPKMQQTYE